MDAVQMGSVPGVRVISTRSVHHSRSIEEEQRKVHLNPWDLCYLSIHHIQKGLVFHKPPPREARGGGGGEQDMGKEEEEEEPDVVTLLRRSLAATLDHFYPLCGRLASVENPEDGTASFFIDCGNQGAEFVHAEAAGVTISDLLAPPFTPRVIRSFFPLNGAVGHDGHSLPLLAVQLTELRDGYFLGCSLNHSAADGTSFWHLLNSWSALARGGGGIPLPPVADHRWFPETLRPPLRLPIQLNHPESFIRRPLVSPEMEDAVFHFPRQAIAALKARANTELVECSGGGEAATISSLQALLAFVWRATTRARGLPPGHPTVYKVAIGLRQRLLRPTPPPPGYLGNLTLSVPVASTAGELLGLTLGQTAALLNRGISALTDEAARRWAVSWAADPVVLYVDAMQAGFLFIGSSPRFDVYGNDFGWGRPLAVRRGVGNKLDGMLTVYPASTTDGSMDLEMYFPPQVLRALMADQDFMSVASLHSAHFPSASARGRRTLRPG